ncbi:hypothetical protein [Flavobacterium caseinilyticum]|uniref:Uncharacterized protein n=1 Tax=Flavobacterium caseinilyticum TaxID=2541732 RepID=A0A4R5AVJ3_9FLAO|nr:hypothetical protein [Flavobacterium caseinilyticum]TDD77121.1 hypothetical protein E0F89_05850 [Flavobacterium caseinilyticum]
MKTLKEQIEEVDLIQTGYEDFYMDSDKIVKVTENYVNEKIDKLIQKIEGETLAHYAYEAIIGMLEDLKFQRE